jgi:Domain of unknown function (DUF4126)
MRGLAGRSLAAVDNNGWGSYPRSVDMPWTAVLSAGALAIVLAACSGLRAILPIFLTGLAARTGLISIGTTFHFITTDRALLIFGLATLLEFIGDKIPAVDHALDVVHTILRPMSGSMLAAAALSTVTEPLHAVVIGFVIGAPTALVPHAVKSTARVASTIMTGGLANPVLSFIEDGIVIVLFAVALVSALLAVFGVVLLLAWVWRRRARRARAVVPAGAPTA